MRRLGFILIFLLIGIQSFAQVTKIRGTVTDADTGEPVPFAGVYFKETTTGLSADINGKFSLETSDHSLTVLVCQLLGYKTKEITITPGVFNTVNFRLKLEQNQLNGATVKADNRKAKRLLANIEANRDRNNPEKRQYYDCDIYNKIDLGLSNVEQWFGSPGFKKNFGFVFDYMDTTTLSGIPYLPVMMSESIVKRYHRTDPALDNEEISANRISGINPDANLLSQFTGSMHLKCNFYAPFINCFDIEFPSPTQSNGLLFYNYFIIDSLQVDGRKTYQVRYHPKKAISSPALDGEMLIDAEDFAIRAIHAKMEKRGNVNWVRDLSFDYEYKRLEDGTWFYDKEHLFTDFSITQNETSKLLSIIGNRTLSYSNPVFADTGEILDKKVGIVKVDKEANFRDEQYWEQARPIELSQKEKNIYKMMDQIQEQKAYKITYNIVYALINGYYDVGPVGFGPYHKLIAFNPLEGFRMRIGMHTSKDLSKKFRFTGYLAYGIDDREFKGGLTYEHLFSKDPTRKLTADAYYDVNQLGKGKGMFTDVNLLSSIFGGGSSQKLAPMSNFSVKYEHEFSLDYNLTVDAAMKRYYANRFVPMVQLDGTGVTSVATNELHAQLRISHEETVNRGHFIKTYVHSKYPIFGLDLTGSIPGLRKGDVGFFRPEFSMNWKFRLPPVGISNIRLNTGTVIGQVPWPLLHLHEGNGTYLLDKSAFACMDYFEFASDSWVTFMLNHNFNGFFLNKIPGMSYLDWREEFTFKMTYGHLSDKNNPTLAGASPTLFAFPEGMKTMGNVPYMEIGVGLSNILQLFRIDCFWRLTHRDTAKKNFSVTVGVEFKF